MHHPTDRRTHTTAFVSPVMEHWLEREIAVYLVKKQTRKNKKVYIFILRRFSLQEVYI